jgi:hypothetical protein
MSMEKDTRRSALAALAALLAASLACGPLPFGAPSAADRVGTLEVELQQARGTAAAEAAESDAGSGESGPPVAQESVSLSDDFEIDTAAFLLGEGAQITDGALLLGPYSECANDVANFDAPVDCLVVCTDCGENLAEFRMSFAFTFEDGLSDREFGAILRLVDENGNRQIDRADYLLALAFNIFDNQWRLYVHAPDEIEPWRQVDSGPGGFLLPGRMNQVVVEGLNGGRIMAVELNGSRILNLTADAPEPGERLVQPWADAGAVGFLGLGRGVTARFDDFVLETID